MKGLFSLGGQVALYQVLFSGTFMFGEFYRPQVQNEAHFLLKTDVISDMFPKNKQIKHRPGSGHLLPDQLVRRWTPQAGIVFDLGS